ncbi:hypothetical protein [Caldivirga sp. MU80]|uniref:hypothetical protein n=1 Tax=Caldivirga sp. MU80 TaxID=1650354 RepID=UPI0008308EB8|nr:hypothetical protein [Caldivirga sp. MU80]
MADATSQLITQIKTMPLFRRRIAKVGNRYFIQLPMELNELWRYWYENGAVLNIVIEVVEYRKANNEKPTSNPNP